MPNADQQYWDAVRTGGRDEEPWPPLPTPESIYRGKCPDGDRCLHGCHRSESCYYVASSPGEREYASWRPRGVTEGAKRLPMVPTNHMMNAAVNAWHSWKSRDSGGNVQLLGRLMWEHMADAAPDAGVAGDANVR